MIRARAIDLPDPSVFAVRAIDQAKFGGQLALCPHDFDLELGTARSWRPRSHVLAVGSLVLESRGEQLVARERDGERAFDLLVLMQDYILAEEEAAGGLALFPPNPSSTSHTYLGEIAIQRAVWRFAPEQLGFTGVERGPEQFVAVRGWAQAHQMPRWVFVRTPEEVKPVFIDLDIPLYVELFCKLARAASRMTVSAMFPSFDDTWLPDAGGNLYTSELRILAVDPVAWSA